jgi:cytohesin
MKRNVAITLAAMAITALAGAADQSATPWTRPLWSQMQLAILRTQDVQQVDAILKQGFDINSPIGCGTFAPLDGAVETGNVEMLKFLLAHGAKPQGRELANAAFAPTPQQAIDMMKVLLKAGVDPNSSNTYSPALVEATARENLDAVTLLLAQPGIKPDAAGPDGETALMCAARNGYSDIVNLLLRAGADPTLHDLNGETAASIAQGEIQNRQSIISRLNATSKPLPLPTDQKSVVQSN